MNAAEAMALDYMKVRKDYAFDPSIFSEESKKVRRVKWIVENRLTRVDRTIILLYAEIGNLRALGAKMHVSHYVMQREVKRIKGIILENYNQKLPIDD